LDRIAHDVMITEIASGTMPSRLTAEEIAAYHECGFVPPFDLVERDEALELGRLVSSRRRSVLDRLRRRPVNTSAPPEVLAVCTRSELLDRVEDILGPNLVLWRTRLFVKTPNEPRYPYHQDGAFWRLENTTTSPPSDATHLGLTAWIALDDVGTENGCVEIIPGSHWRLLGHHPDLWTYGKGIAEENFATTKSAPMLMKAGQCFLFHYLAVHRSGVNRSRRTRVGFSARFTVPGVVAPDARTEFRGGPLLVRGSKRQGPANCQ
jgi:ectoine hydroxylase-related dioxygenase (phytanoyl-CoA dioxygenase family)